MPTRTRAPEVYKFGGASLADARAVRHAVEIIRSGSVARSLVARALVAQSRTKRSSAARPSSSHSLVVVVSALAGVTDALLAVTAQAQLGHMDRLAEAIEALHRRHREVARGAVTQATARRALLNIIDASFDELTALLRAVASLRELTARTSDFVVARGERLSAHIMASLLNASRLRAQFVDATDVICTDSEHGGASPDLAATDRLARQVLRPLLSRGIIPVVPGFLGRTPEGTVATLGRGGSDLTAALIGRAMKAARVTLWKDVPGLLTTDPRLVPSAHVIPQLNVREAAELAYYGAKVLHPRALIPLVHRALPVFIRPFADPTSAGTEISTRRTLVRYPVKALSVVGSQALVTVTGNGMLGVPGIAARTFSAMQHAGISVSLISQASSEHSICLCVPAAAADRATEALDAAFAHERARREIDGVSVVRDVAMLAVVGLGMAGAPGIASRVFTSLAAAKVNVVAIAQGSSELNISVVVSGAQAVRAVRAVHNEFQLDKIGGGAIATDGRVDVILLGFGRIGRELVRMLPRAKARARLTVVGLMDRSGYVFDAKGIGTRRLLALAAAKEAGAALSSLKGATPARAADAVHAISRHALSRPILVDLTAEDTLPALRAAVAGGMDIVLANKRPLTASRAEVDALQSLATLHQVRIRHETTVGAGLPIMDAFAKLVESGDSILRIEGCTSGTLGFLLTEVGKGRAFSESVRKAMARGYTEPDPRDDLSGMDVARKALILARMLGYRGELSDVAVESLVPSAARRLTVQRYVATLESHDASWRERQAQATAQGQVLRYVLSVTSRTVKVGLKAVARTHPLASLSGTDNQIVFTTRRYRENPLVISGPGAGPAVTAAGVLNDLLTLAVS